jgi:hypothetical protein
VAFHFCFILFGFATRVSEHKSRPAHEPSQGLTGANVMFLRFGAVVCAAVLLCSATGPALLAHSRHPTQQPPPPSSPAGSPHTIWRRCCGWPMW